MKKKLSITGNTTNKNIITTSTNVISNKIDFCRSHSLEQLSITVELNSSIDVDNLIKLLENAKPCFLTQSAK